MDLSQLKKQSTEGKKKLSKAFNESKGEDVLKNDDAVPEEKGKRKPEIESGAKAASNEEAEGGKAKEAAEASINSGEETTESTEPQGKEKNSEVTITKEKKKGKRLAVYGNNVFYQLDVDLGEIYEEIRIEEQRNEQINLAENKKQDIEKMAAVLNVTQKALLGVMIEKFKDEHKNVIEKIAIRNVKNLF